MIKKLIFQFWPAWLLTVIFMLFVTFSNPTAVTAGLVVFFVAIVWAVSAVINLQKIMAHSKQSYIEETHGMLKSQILEFFDNMSTTNNREVPPIMASMDQLQGIISDANLKLHQSFNGLIESSQQQNNLTMKIVG